MFEDYPDVVTVSEVQKMLRISRGTVMRLLQDEKIQHRTVGRRILISKEGVIAYLRSN